MSAINDKKYVIISGLFAFWCNAVLFILKLYVGLSSNSISIYSDGINNLLDSLSGFLATACFLWAIRRTEENKERIIGRTEALVSFIMSLAVVFSALCFGYNSLERFMYPTPVWYTDKYFIIILFTLWVKLCMLFVLRLLKKKASSPITRVFAFDGILDVFISAVTLLTLILAKNGTYSADAVIGVLISIFLITGSIKLLAASVKAIIFDKEETNENEKEN